MLTRVRALPFVVILMGLTALAMLIPAAYASVIKDHATARAFFYSAVLTLILTLLVALATANYTIRRPGRSHLISMLVFFTVVPVVLAVPFAEAVPTTRFINAYVEMVSSLTTTGLTLFDPQRLPPAVHLWRALVGWMGGFFVWVTAVAILAPLNLGGFEVASTAQAGQGAGARSIQIDRIADPSERLVRFAWQLFPVYAGLTVALWTGLIIVGENSLVAVCHAMSTLSTSGISPVGGVDGGKAGIRGEVLIFVFLVFALSRRTFFREHRSEGFRRLWRDPELRLGLAIVAGLTALLFLRHWYAAIEEDTNVSLAEGLKGLWGALFTVTSFLTTTGFESHDWVTARSWSGFQSPGVLLLGLAVFGGGVATTAGGVKLLRVYALYRHGMRELERLVLPSSVGGSGLTTRRFRRQGAYVAWIFFMLFAISIAVVMSLLSLTVGLNFEDAMILTVASLSTTGPLVQSAGDVPVNLAGLSDIAKGIVSAAMVLGRLETLAIIALLNPEFWR